MPINPRFLNRKRATTEIGQDIFWATDKSTKSATTFRASAEYVELTCAVTGQARGSVSSTYASYQGQIMVRRGPQGTSLFVDSLSQKWEIKKYLQNLKLQL